MAGYDGMNGEYASRLQQFIAASGGRNTITSGYRSPERQAQLWANALKEYGDPEIADNWVARPGKSNHGKGIAADLGFANAAAREWAHANAAKFGLVFPMSWEPWHIEPIGLSANSDPGAYTTPPTGFENPAVVQEDPHDPAVQMGRMMGAMFGQQQGGMEGPDTSVLDTPAAPGAMSEPEQQINAIGTGVDDGTQ